MEELKELERKPSSKGTLEIEKPGFAEGEKDEGSNVITVTISEVPGRTIKFTGERGKLTLEDAMKAAKDKGLKIARKDVTLNNRKVDLSTKLEDGDVILFVSQVSGGKNL